MHLAVGVFHGLRRDLLAATIGDFDRAGNPLCEAVSIDLLEQSGQAMLEAFRGVLAHAASTIDAQFMAARVADGYVECLTPPHDRFFLREVMSDFELTPTTRLRRRANLPCTIRIEQDRAHHQAMDPCVRPCGGGTHRLPTCGVRALSGQRAV